MFTTTKEKLIQHLKGDLKLEKKDIVFLHSGVLGLGQVEGGINTITEAFKEVLSEGLLVIPSYTYSWCKGEGYDSLETECPDMGAYAKDAWKDHEFIRSSNPNFAVAALSNSHNQHLIELMFSSPSERTCFGKGSVFDRMYQFSGNRNGFILLLGGAHSDVVFRCTFLHYIEELKNIPYRYIKRFSNPENSSSYVEQLVRFFSIDEFNTIRGKSEKQYNFPIQAKYNQLGKDLISSKMITIRPYGYSKSRMVNIQKFCDWLKIKIDESPEYLLN